MTAPRPVVVGIASQHTETLASVAIDLARRFDRELVCVGVDLSRYATIDDSGHSVSMPIDPDSFRECEALDPATRSHIRDLAARADVNVRFEVAAGDPARELARVAYEVDAPLIVVGTHEASVRHSIKEFVAGSVATHLAHHQHRPVVVVPLTPVDPEQSLPWDTR